MVTGMKRVLLCLSLLCLPLAAAELTGVHSVYMLPMANGLDQYLANRLTTEHVLQVVTDPQRADAILTDRIGEPFETRLDDLYPPPAPKEPPKPKTSEKKPADQDSAPPPAFGDTVNKLPKPGSINSFGRAKGTVFLVDVKTRQILWSIYERPKDTSSRQLDRTAVRIANQLKDDIAGKPVKQ